MDIHKLLKSLKKQKIGLFDSGIGGVSILNQLLWINVKEFVYIADTKYLPYGNKSHNFLIKRGTQLTHYFLSQKIDTIVVACHTSSATSLGKLKQLFPQVTYIDMLQPTINTTIKQTKNNRVGIMATQSSINTHVHKKLLLAQNSSVFVFEQPCPDFVPLIESHAPIQELEKAIKNYLDPLIAANIDTLILGCTHYAFLETLIHEQAPHLTLVSAASILKNASGEKIKEDPNLTIVVTKPLYRIKKSLQYYLTKINYTLKEYDE